VFLEPCNNFQKTKIFNRKRRHSFHEHSSYLIRSAQRIISDQKKYKGLYIYAYICIYIYIYIVRKIVGIYNCCNMFETFYIPVRFYLMNIVKHYFIHAHASYWKILVLVFSLYIYAATFIAYCQ
jgi:hypothetical protein